MVERKTLNLVVVGSSPTEGALFVNQSRTFFTTTGTISKFNIKYEESILLQLAFVAQLAARGSHNPKVAGSIPVESRFIPVSLGGQDTRLSPESPGFNSRTGNFFILHMGRKKFLGKKDHDLA